jgi:hypothetical protein
MSDAASHTRPPAWVTSSKAVPPRIHCSPPLSTTDPVAEAPSRSSAAPLLITVADAVPPPSNAYPPTPTLVPAASTVPVVLPPAKRNSSPPASTNVATAPPDAPPLSTVSVPRDPTMPEMLRPPLITPPAELLSCCRPSSKILSNTVPPDSTTSRPPTSVPDATPPVEMIWRAPSSTELPRARPPAEIVCDPAMIPPLSVPPDRVSAPAIAVPTTTPPDRTVKLPPKSTVMPLLVCETVTVSAPPDEMVGDSMDCSI